MFTRMTDCTVEKRRKEKIRYLWRDWLEEECEEMGIATVDLSCFTEMFSRSHVLWGRRRVWRFVRKRTHINPAVGSGEQACEPFKTALRK